MEKKLMKLDARMKFYESLSSGNRLLPLIPICARMDGKAFHTFTRHMERPFDEKFCQTMQATTDYLVQETGARIGYTQSDEISLIWLSDSFKSQIFFDGRQAKMTSILAAMTSVKFNEFLKIIMPEKHKASRQSFPIFDARVWNVPTKQEAINYLYWREDDATKNSITMAAQKFYSHKELHGKHGGEQQEMLHQKDVNWNNYPTYFKRGYYVQRKKVLRPFNPEEIEKLPEKHEARTNPNLEVERTTYSQLIMDPIRQVENIIDVVFDGAKPA